MWLAAVPLVVVLNGRGTPGAIETAWILMGVIIAAFLADGFIIRTQARLRLDREAPAQLYVEQPNRIGWVVENPNAFPLQLVLSDRVPAGATADPHVLELKVAAALSHDLGVRAGSHGARHGRLRRSRLPSSWASGPCLVATEAAGPAGGSLSSTPRQRQGGRAGGAACTSAPGGKPPLPLARCRHGVRITAEYSSQDDIRWVDWKATARLSRPISRNYEVERHQQVVLLVDSSRALSTFCGHRTKFDAMLEAAILVARAALGQGDGLGLVAFSDQVDAYLHPRRERAQLKAVLEHLYAKLPRLVEPNYEAALTLAAKRNSRRTLFILFTDITVTEAARRMLVYLRVLTPRHLPLVVTIADETIEQNELLEPRTPQELYRVGVATELMYERTLLLEELRRSGVEVLDCRADQVAARAIERYLELKRRLRL